jgi:hypothetical protein
MKDNFYNHIHTAKRLARRLAAVVLIAPLRIPSGAKALCEAADVRQDFGAVLPTVSR